MPDESKSKCKKKKRASRYWVNPVTNKYERAPTRKHPHTNRHLHEKRMMDAIHRTMRVARMRSG